MFFFVCRYVALVFLYEINETIETMERNFLNTIYLQSLTKVSKSQSSTAKTATQRH